MTERACRICGSQRISERFRLGNAALLACADCTVRFLDPQPTDVELERIYSGNYFAIGEGVDAQEHARLKQASADLTLALLPPPAPGATLVDIGCGTGDFLVAAARRAYAATGIEFSSSNAALAAAKVPGSVIVGDIETARIEDAAFDVVASSDVIEHVRDPIAFARHVRRVLKPDGVAVISTPSTASWSSRVLGNRWIEYKPEHLFYFNPQSLERVLRAGGFGAVSVVPNFKVLNLAYIAMHFKRFPVPVLGALVRGFTAVLPPSLGHRPFRIVASGITAIAR